MTHQVLTWLSSCAARPNNGNSSSSSTNMRAKLAVAAAAGSSLVLLHHALSPDSSRWTKTTTLDDCQNAPNHTAQSTQQFSHQINVDFMDRLATKPYLHFSGRHHKVTNSTIMHEGGTVGVRPVGVPDTLRILTIDLPEVRQGFRNGHCSVDTSRIYPDGIASPEILTVETSKTKGGKVQISVEQKAWVKSMVRCISNGSANDNKSRCTTTDKVSVEIMEADVSRMNPSNIRRIHQYGTLRYDPGKYTVTSPRTDQPPPRLRQAPPQRRRRKSLIRDDNNKDEEEEAKLLKEMEAPWHQNAWREEAMLRIGGQVGFGEAMRESDGWTKRIWGHQFQSTVPSSRSILDFLLWRRASSINNPGMDGGSLAVPTNPASNRPHAVIANGLALQMVPNSLRLLQKLCAEYDVPLFVIRDPRSWGGNTHPDDLGQVLKDLQKVVKQRIVTRSLEYSAGTAFQRGRIVGRFEANAGWQAKEALRQSKEATDKIVHAFLSASSSTSSLDPQTIDWSTLSEEDLEKLLEYHGLIRLDHHEGDSDDNHETTASIRKKELAETLSKIAARYHKNPPQERKAE